MASKNTKATAPQTERKPRQKTEMPAAIKHQLETKIAASKAAAKIYTILAPLSVEQRTEVQSILDDIQKDQDTKMP